MSVIQEEPVTFYPPTVICPRCKTHYRPPTVLFNALGELRLEGRCTQCGQVNYTDTTLDQMKLNIRHYEVETFRIDDPEKYDLSAAIINGPPH